MILPIEMHVTPSKNTTASRSAVPSDLDEALLEQVWVVMAAYNESVHVFDTVQSLRPQFTNIVIVDDGSSDDTYEQACRSGAKALRHVINRGQGAALQTGINYAVSKGASYVVTFDSDGQHSPQDALAMLHRIHNSENLDIVLGSRFLEHSSSVPFLRKLLLRAAIVFTKLTTGLNLTDTHNGLRVFTREAASRICITMDRMAHASQILDEVSRLDLRYAEFPVRITYTDYSKGKGQTNSAAFRVLMEYLLGRITK